MVNGQIQQLVTRACTASSQFLACSDLPTLEKLYVSVDEELSNVLLQLLSIPNKDAEPLVNTALAQIMNIIQNIEKHVSLRMYMKYTTKTTTTIHSIHIHICILP